MKKSAPRSFASCACAASRTAAAVWPYPTIVRISAGQSPVATDPVFASKNVDNYYSETGA
jgi:hypothetical protein